MPPSRVQDNIAVVRRLLDGMLTEDNIDHYDQLIDTDIRIHGPASSHVHFELRCDVLKVLPRSAPLR